jgi:aspartokinase
VTSHDLEALASAIPDLGRFGQVDLRTGKAILAVVGRFIHETPGIGARVMNAVAAAKVNVEMHSFGMRSNNISVVIDDAAIAHVVPVLHEALFETGG